MSFQRTQPDQLPNLWKVHTNLGQNFLDVEKQQQGVLHELREKKVYVMEAHGTVDSVDV